jgi:hypothetical protein
MAVEQQRLEARVTGGGKIVCWAITDVEDGVRRQAEEFGGVLKDCRAWFGDADVAGNDDVLEERRETQCMKERAESVIPVGEDGQLEIRFLKSDKRGEDLVMDHPGGWLAEVLIEGGEERLARGRIDQAEKRLVDDGGPIVGAVEGSGGRQKGFAETLSEDGRRESRVAVLICQFGIDMTDRRAWIHERGTNVEGYGADIWQGRGDGGMRLRIGGGEGDVEMPDEKGPAIGGFVDELSDGLTGSEARGGFNSNEDWGRAGVGVLKGGGEFKAVGWNDAVVAVGGGDEGSGVSGAGLEIMEWGVSEQMGKILAIFRRAILGCPGPTNGEFVEAEHVHDTAGRECGGEEAGALSHAGADQETAVATAADGEGGVTGVVVEYEPFSGGDEIVEGVLFIVFHSGLVPGLAIFAAAAGVGDGVNAAEFHPSEASHGEGGGEADVEAAVSEEVGGVAAVKGEVFAVRQEQWDAGAVLAAAEDLACYVVVGIELEGGLAEEGLLAGAQVVVINGAGGGEAGEGEEGFGVMDTAAEAGGGAESGERHGTQGVAVEIEHVDAAAGVLEIESDELTIDEVGAEEAIG